MNFEKWLTFKYYTQKYSIFVRKLDVIEKNGLHFCNQHLKVHKRQSANSKQFFEFFFKICVIYLVFRIFIRINKQKFYIIHAKKEALISKDNAGTLQVHKLNYLLLAPVN